MASPRIRSWLREYVVRTARRLGVRLYHFSNNGSHLHLVVLPGSQSGLANFLRVLGGMIPRKVLSAEKGKARNVKFWERRPYSRVLTWGNEFRNVMLYVQRNALEAIGRIAYRARSLALDSKTKRYIERELSLRRFCRESYLNAQAVLF